MCLGGARAAGTTTNSHDSDDAFSDRLMPGELRRHVFALSQWHQLTFTGARRSSCGLLLRLTTCGQLTSADVGSLGAAKRENRSSLLLVLYLLLDDDHDVELVEAESQTVRSSADATATASLCPTEEAAPTPSSLRLSEDSSGCGRTSMVLSKLALECDWDR